MATSYPRQNGRGRGKLRIYLGAGTMNHRGATLTEMDLDAVLARHPRIALVDELAHTNVPGCRNGLTAGADGILDIQRALVASVGGSFQEVPGEDVPETLLRFARAENATQIVLGASLRGRVEVRITDQGPDERDGSVSLALRLATDLAEAMGVTLRCERAPSGGRTVIIILPATARPSARATYRDEEMQRS